MKFLVEVDPETGDESSQDLENLIEEAIRDYGYSAKARVVEEEDE